MTTSAFITDVPPLVAGQLAATNETSGAFTQTKRLPDGDEFVSHGVWRIRPGVDFLWKITEPFEATFWADKQKYSYSNEDEFVEKSLSEMRGFSRLKDVADGDFSVFFETFDALYKEDADGFHILAKPRDNRISQFLERIEADGAATNWVFRATFPDRATFSIHITSDNPRP